MHTVAAWDARTVTAVMTVVIALLVFAVARQDKRRDRRRDEREQAAQVAGWVDLDWEELTVTFNVRNASKQPIYDLVAMVRDRRDLDHTMNSPEWLEVLPPETTKSRGYVCTDRAALEAVNPRLFISFRDAEGRVWRRDSHGRLTSTRRLVDQAPPPGLTGRIDIQPLRGAGRPLLNTLPSRRVLLLARTKHVLSTILPGRSRDTAPLEVPMTARNRYESQQDLG